MLRDWVGRRLLKHVSLCGWCGRIGIVIIYHSVALQGIFVIKGHSADMMITIYIQTQQYKISFQGDLLREIWCLCFFTIAKFLVVTVYLMMMIIHVFSDRIPTYMYIETPGPFPCRRPVVRGHVCPERYRLCPGHASPTPEYSNI